MKVKGKWSAFCRLSRENPKERQILSRDTNPFAMTTTMMTAITFMKMKPCEIEKQQRQHPSGLAGKATNE